MNFTKHLEEQTPQNKVREVWDKNIKMFLHEAQRPWIIHLIVNSFQGNYFLLKTQSLRKQLTANSMAGWIPLVVSGKNVSVVIQVK